MRETNILPGCGETHFWQGREGIMFLHMTLGLDLSEVTCTSHPYSKRQTHTGTGAEGGLRMIGEAGLRSKLSAV